MLSGAIKIGTWDCQACGESVEQWGFPPRNDGMETCVLVTPNYHDGEPTSPDCVYLLASQGQVDDVPGLQLMSLDDSWAVGIVPADGCADMRINLNAHGIRIGERFHEFAGGPGHWHSPFRRFWQLSGYMSPNVAAAIEAQYRAAGWMVRRRTWDGKRWHFDPPLKCESDAIRYG